MRLVDRYIIKDNRFEDICLKSGLLYNYVLYLVRQGIFNKEYLKEYDLSTKLGRENQFDFRQLPASVSQQVVGQVFKSVNSWIKLKSDFDRNPDKYNNHRPQYKKGKKQNMVVFKIMYKAKLLGIEVVTHEESYTSKIDHLAFEEMKYQDNYLGKRKRRGLFQSSIGKLINADINGAIGIARKVVGDSCINTIVSSGFAFNPIRLNIL